MIKNNLLDTKLLELSQILKKVLEYKSKYQYEDGLFELKKAYKQLLGLNGDLVEKLNIEDVMALVSAHEAAEVYKLIILTKILEAESDIYDSKNDIGKAINFKLKSLQVFNRAILLDKETTLNTSKESIDQIIEYLNTYEIHAKAYEIIMEHFELMGRFDKAEDAFYDLLEENKYNTEFIKLGINFYSRLLEKEKDELDKGNLTFLEVKEGLEYLQGLQMWYLTKDKIN